MNRALSTALAAALAFAAPVTAGPANCVNGVADGHACHRVDFVARLDTNTLGYGDLNDVWGWTDPVGGREYALVGAVNGTVFVDITDPTAPRIVGRLPAHEDIISPSKPRAGKPAAAASADKMCKAGDGGAPGGGPRPAHEDCDAGASTWRNIKVHLDHAFIGSESAGHGLQVFDLTQLRAFPPGSPVQLFDETAHYAGFGNSHTLDIDEASGFLYAVGSNTFSGGPHFVDISNPLAPAGVGGYAGDGYSHEILCRVYAGPDVAYTGRQICFGSNTDSLTILDVTAKNAPVQVSRTQYTFIGYTHQGWLSADQRYFFVNDELDEINFGERTRTLVWDLQDLDAPVVAAEILQPRFVIDHNNYVHDGFVYQSNYTAGLIILDGRDAPNAHEVAFFDTRPADDNRVFDGTWSNYPYFASGVVAVSDISRGLYLVRPQLGGAAADAVVTLALNGGQIAGLPGGTVTPGVAGGTFTVSSGPFTRIQSITIDDPAVNATCSNSHLAVVRCRLTGATPFQYSVSVVATGGAPFNTTVIAMVASGGVESDASDNSARFFMQAQPPDGGGGGGGGGALDVALLAIGILMSLRTPRSRRGAEDSHGAA